MWNLHQPILTDSSRTRGPQNLLQGDFKKCPVYSTPHPKVTVIIVTNAEYLSRNSESHPSALASLIQVTSLFCTRCSAVTKLRGAGVGYSSAGGGGTEQVGHPSAGCAELTPRLPPGRPSAHCACGGWSLPCFLPDPLCSQHLVAKLLCPPSSLTLLVSLVTGIFQREANRTVMSCAVLPMRDDLS